MCRSLVARVTAVDGDGLRAVVATGGATARVGLVALDHPVAPGDWVLVNAGLAIARLDDHDVAELAALGEGDHRAS